MTFSDSENFTCNICGVACKRLSAPPGREVPSCSTCGSTVRLRSLIALLSREIFGIELAIPDFPVLKGIRGFGMSDPPALAQRLAESSTTSIRSTIRNRESMSGTWTRAFGAGTISSCRAK